MLPNDPIEPAEAERRRRASEISGAAGSRDGGSRWTTCGRRLDIVNGDVSLHPLSFGIGRGQITSRHPAWRSAANALAREGGRRFPARGCRQAAGGDGRRAGRRRDRRAGGDRGHRPSLAEILGGGNGELKLYMGSGGNLSALLVDLSGLQFGNALLSALGRADAGADRVPDHRFRAEAAARRESRLTMLDTDEARIGITGGVNLQNEALGLALRTEAEAFQHRLAAGADRDQRDAGQAEYPAGSGGSRGAGRRRRSGLGVVLTPLAALLPTIQSGHGRRRRVRRTAAGDEDAAARAGAVRRRRRSDAAVSVSPLRRAPGRGGDGLGAAHQQEQQEAAGP